MIPSPNPSNKSSYFFSQYSQDQFLDRHIFKGRMEVTKKFLLNVSLVNYCSKDICLFFFRGDFSLSQDLQMASNTQTVWYLQKTWLAGQKLISRREMKEIFKSQAFELLHKWTGLLVEANPAIFPVGFLSGRKAWQVICFPF